VTREGGSLPESILKRKVRNMSDEKWFALSVKHRQEDVVAAHLKFKGYQVFLPVYQSRRIWSDRVRVLSLPLFPGYVFCQFNLSNRTTPVVTTPGVVRILGIGANPSPVDDKELAAIQRITRSELECEPWSYLHEGSRVRIAAGSLTGVEGVVVEQRSEMHLVVSITLLRRSVAVHIDPAWVKRLDNIAPPQTRTLTGSVQKTADHAA
jgi:transcription antitermination factor NusG